MPIRPVIDLEAAQLRHKMFQESTPPKTTNGVNNMTLQEQNFSKTTQELIDFIQQNKHYSGNLTKDTACQLLRDIELDATKQSEALKVAAEALRDLLNAVEYGGIVDLPNDAGKGYMARVPTGFAGDAQQALATIENAEK